MIISKNNYHNETGDDENRYPDWQSVVGRIECQAQIEQSIDRLHRLLFATAAKQYNRLTKLCSDLFRCFKKQTTCSPSLPVEQEPSAANKSAFSSRLQMNEIDKTIGKCKVHKKTYRNEYGIVSFNNHASSTYFN